MSKYVVVTGTSTFEVAASRVSVKEGFVIFIAWDSNAGIDREVALFPAAHIVRVLDPDGATETR